MEFEEKYNRVIGKAGFMALRHGLLEQAGTIFSGLEAAAPDKIGPVLGQAMLLMNKKDYPAAIARLEQDALKMDESDPFARTYLGLALYLDKQMEQSRQILEKVVADNMEATTTELAKGLLEEMK